MYGIYLTLNRHLSHIEHACHTPEIYTLSHCQMAGLYIMGTICPNYTNLLFTYSNVSLVAHKSLLCADYYLDMHIETASLKYARNKEEIIKLL